MSAPGCQPVMENSGAAIDRLSLHCRDIWYRNRGGGEELQSGLTRLATEALAGGAPDGGGRCFHQGLALEFRGTGDGLVLRSVVRLSTL